MTFETLNDLKNQKPRVLRARGFSFKTVFPILQELLHLKLFYV
jgi:hypothetical protein